MLLYVPAISRNEHQGLCKKSDIYDFRLQVLRVVEALTAFLTE